MRSSAAARAQRIAVLPPAQTSPPRPSSPVPSRPPSPGEEGENRNQLETVLLPSPGEGGREGTGEGPGVRVRQRRSAAPATAASCVPIQNHRRETSDGISAERRYPQA